MSIYKKGINTLNSARDIEYVMSNNSGIYMSQAVIGENVAPYHGLFIKQNEKQDEIYLSKLVEQIKIGSKMYSITDITTNEEQYGGVEYLEQFDRYPVPCFRYKYCFPVILKVTLQPSFILSVFNLSILSLLGLNNVLLFVSGNILILTFSF